jgi:hypothetical protein
VQREAATFDRLSDLINYQREARFLACCLWAEAHGYENGAAGYSGEKLVLLDNGALFMFSTFFNLKLVKLITSKHHGNEEATLEEILDLWDTLNSAPVKFQWNQVGGPMSVGGSVEEE